MGGHCLASRRISLGAFKPSRLGAFKSPKADKEVRHRVFGHVAGISCEFQYID
jgi:hypothetical protein